jgi:parvulin-like peptidyl-prolyl cis-trans isomerase-like protein
VHYEQLFPNGGKKAAVQRPSSTFRQMPRIRSIAAACTATLALAACSGLKDALTGHTDIAARAGSRQLTVKRLSEMMASTPVPARKDVGVAIANLWVNYQLLGQAAAAGDTLTDPKLIDEAMWASIANLKGKKFTEAREKMAPPADTSGFEKHYAAGDGFLVARHILIMGDRDSLKPPKMDSVRRLAESVVKQTTPANFTQMVTKYSQDPGSKQTGGEYVFPKGMMVQEFEKATLALKPGEMSGLVQSKFGFHIILRESWTDAKPKYTDKYMTLAKGATDSVYFAKLEADAKIDIKPTAAKTVKAVGADVDAYRTDNTLIASSNKGNLTAARLARWVAAYPPQAKIREQIASAPDSVMPIFIKYIMRNDMMLKAADSAKITLDTAEVNGVRRAFQASVMNSMTGLRVAPAQLLDSAKTRADKEKLAAARIETYMDALLKNQAQFVDVTEPVSVAVKMKYESRIVTAGIERAVADAAKAKAAADSAKSKAMGSSVVPMPGAAPAPPAGPPATAAPPKPKPTPVPKSEPAKKP